MRAPSAAALAAAAAACAVLSAAPAHGHATPLSLGRRRTLAESLRRREGVAAALASVGGGGGGERGGGSPPAPPAAAAAAVTLTASPAAPLLDHAGITVSWAGVPSPSPTDWVAQYCVGTPLDSWLEWDYVSEAAGWASGSGSLVFSAFRTGCSLEYRLYRDPAPYTRLATSNPVVWPGGPLAPYQLHVAYGAVPQTQMAVSWTTAPAPAAPPAGVLQVGSAPGVYDLPNVTAAPPVTYAAGELCQAPANTSSPEYWTHPGYFHHALVIGLAAGTRYYARPVARGGPAGDVPGAETSFLTGAAVGPDVPVRFVTYGDMAVSAAPGASTTAMRVSARLDAGEPITAIIHCGDLSYGEGRVGVHDEWMAMIQPVASRTAYMVSIG